MSDDRIKPDRRREPAMLAVEMEKVIIQGTPLPVVLKAIEMLLVQYAMSLCPDSVEDQQRALMLSFGSAVNAIKLAAAIRPEVDKLHEECKAEGRQPTHEEVAKVMTRVRDSVLGQRAQGGDKAVIQ